MSNDIGNTRELCVSLTYCRHYGYIGRNDIRIVEKQGLRLFCKWTMFVKDKIFQCIVK